MTKPLDGHENLNPGSVKGYSESHHERRARDAYASKESPGWDKIEIPKSQDYRERRKASNKVAVPPELNLP